MTSTLPDPSPAEPSGRGRRSLGLGVIRYLLAGGMVWLALQLVDVSKLLPVWQETHPAGALLAWLMIHLAQLLSVKRMQLYAEAHHVKLGNWQAFRLYYLGMLYNLILPGGIGGDGWKAWQLRQNYGVKLLTAGRWMLAERANGLWALLLVLACLLPAVDLFGYGWWLAFMLAVASSAGYWLVGRRITGESSATSSRAFGWSLFSQIAVLASVWALLWGMGIPSTEWPDYAAIFMLAAVAGVLPITVAGVGVRELLYALAPAYVAVNAGQGVAFSLLWFGLYALVAWMGVAGLIKK